MPIPSLRPVALNTAINGKWTSLLNNKYAKFKSELSIRLNGGKLTVEKREIDGKPFLQGGGPD